MNQHCYHSTRIWTNGSYPAPQPQDPFLSRHRHGREIKEALLVSRSCVREPHLGKVRSGICLPACYEVLRQRSASLTILERTRKSIISILHRSYAVFIGQNIEERTNLVPRNVFLDRLHRGLLTRKAPEEHKVKCTNGCTLPLLRYSKQTRNVIKACFEARDITEEDRVSDGSRFIEARLGVSTEGGRLARSVASPYWNRAAMLIVATNALFRLDLAAVPPMYLPSRLPSSRWRTMVSN